MSAVKVYVTNYCPYCVQAKRFLDRMGVAYEVIDISQDPDQRMWLAERTGMRTVPQIIVGETPVGGYTDMVAADRAGTFRPLLDEAGVSYQP